MLYKLREHIRQLADPEKAKSSQRFFKTATGEYGFGDVFLGLTVPQQRKIAAQYKTLHLQDIERLLESQYHEERLIALFILVLQFGKATEHEQKAIFLFYLAHTKYINNWDLVDSSAHKIVGEYLLNKEKEVLITLANSKSIWERRIAIIATYQFIIHGEYVETFRISEILLHDTHDLIHKAVGWMLREVGKRCSKEIEETFLRKRYKVMPRTMLRYAIEHFSVDERKAYLTGKL